MLLSQFREEKCPICQETKSHTIDIKLFGITKLVECNYCKLRYRTPQDSSKYSFQFYQSSYIQKGLTTDLPNDNELEELIKFKFSKTEKDASFLNPVLQYISNYLGRKISVLDYGANWGYTAFQFQLFDCVEDVKCFELSKLRRAYGEEKLNMSYLDNIDCDDFKFDLLFSAHVIEHMENPLELKECANKLLKDDGILLLTCPNGSDHAKNNKNWSKVWGELHRNFISDMFLCRNFSDYKGAVFNGSLLNDVNFVSNLCNQNMCSMLPDDSDLWFIAQKDLGSL